MLKKTKKALAQMFLRWAKGLDPVEYPMESVRIQDRYIEQHHLHKIRVAGAWNMDGYMYVDIKSRQMDPHEFAAKKAREAAFLRIKDMLSAEMSITESGNLANGGADLNDRITARGMPREDRLLTEAHIEIYVLSKDLYEKITSRCGDF